MDTHISCFSETYMDIHGRDDKNILYREKDHDQGYRDFISQLDVTYTKNTLSTVKKSVPWGE